MGPASISDQISYPLRTPHTLLHKKFIKIDNTSPSPMSSTIAKVERQLKIVPSVRTSALSHEWTQEQIDLLPHHLAKITSELATLDQKIATQKSAMNLPANRFNSALQVELQHNIAYKELLASQISELSQMLSDPHFFEAVALVQRLQESSNALLSLSVFDKDSETVLSNYQNALRSSMSFFLNLPTSYPPEGVPPDYLLTFIRRIQVIDDTSLRSAYKRIEKAERPRLFTRVSPTEFSDKKNSLLNSLSQASHVFYTLQHIASTALPQRENKEASVAATHPLSFIARLLPLSESSLNKDLTSLLNDSQALLSSSSVAGASDSKYSKQYLSRLQSRLNQLRSCVERFQQSPPTTNTPLS